MSNHFSNIASARKSLRNIVSTYGLIVGLGLIHEVVSEKVAGSRGRSTLEEVPYHTVRRGITAHIKETKTADDKAFEAPKVSATDRKTAHELLAQYGTEGLLKMLSDMYPEAKAFATATTDHTTAMERLADRRSKFFPSAKAQQLKLVTLVPVRDEE